MQVTLIAQDLSGLGQLSMGVAIPIFSAVNLPIIMAPTVIYSTQTEGFGTPVRQPMDNWLIGANQHWEMLPDVEINNVLIGYLGSVTSLANVSKQLEKLTPTLVLIDPVMADQGGLYAGFDQTYVKAMQKLICQATVVTPNWTEAQLLIDQPANLQPTDLNILSILKKFQANNVMAQVIITGIERDEHVGIAYLDADRATLRFIWQKKIVGHFYGTGDIFSALLSTYLITGTTLTQALHKTMDAFKIVMAENRLVAPENRKYGMKMRNLISYLAKTEGE